MLGSRDLCLSLQKALYTCCYIMGVLLYAMLLNLMRIVCYLIE